MELNSRYVKSLPHWARGSPVNYREVNMKLSERMLQNANHPARYYAEKVRQLEADLDHFEEGYLDIRRHLRIDNKVNPVTGAADRMLALDKAMDKLGKIEEVLEIDDDY